MTDSVRVETGSLGGSPLSRLAQAGRAPDAWYPGRPATVEQWREHLEAVRKAASAGWCERLADAIDVTPGSAAARRLSAVTDGRGVVVTTGQQAGLFGGPVYTWSKALSALALADVLEAETGIPAAPVFWAATDDADLAEASWTIVAGPDGAERLTMQAVAPDGIRMADLPLPDVSAQLERLVAASGSSAWRLPLELVRQAYGGATTVGAAYVALLRGLLEPLGVAVLDAAHPAMSDAGHPILRLALHERERIHRFLSERGTAIRAAGFEPQVHEVDELTLVFERAGGVRARVARRRGAVAAATAASGSLAPNVLLRPVVERSVLPTAAYMAGPAELAYFAQVSAVAAALEVAQPLAVPRWSATLIEPRVADLMDRHRVTESELADPHAAETRLAKEAWPEPLTRAVAQLRETLAEGIGAVRAVAMEQGELLPPAVVEGLARQIAWRVGRLERRVTAGIKRREQSAMRDLRMLRASLYPEGLRQERALNLLPILARHGPGVLDDMRAAARQHARFLTGAGAETGALP